MLPHRYQQVADDLRAKIGSGHYPVGTRLPTKPALMEHYGVALGTLDRAIEELRRIGLVETRQGSGMFVRKPPPEHSEYEVVMERVDALAEELRLLRERVESVERQREAASGLSRRAGARDRGPRPSAHRAGRGLLPAVPGSSAP
jgi:DNA-binding GntR family transcriptional regulator